MKIIGGLNSNQVERKHKLPFKIDSGGAKSKISVGSVYSFNKKLSIVNLENEGNSFNRNLNKQWVPIVEDSCKELEDSAFNNNCRRRLNVGMNNLKPFVSPIVMKGRERPSACSYNSFEALMDLEDCVENENVGLQLLKSNQMETSRVALHGEEKSHSGVLKVTSSNKVMMHVLGGHKDHINSHVVSQ